MKNRLIVAAFLIVGLYLVLLSGFAEHIVWAMAVSVACAIAAHEMCNLTASKQPFVPAVLAGAILSPLLAWAYAEIGIFLAIATCIPLIVLFHSISVPREDPLASILVTMANVMYIAIPAGLAVILRQTEAGFDLVLLMCACVFANDSGAYFTGRLIGKHKLAPRISPNKSIEGFIGGVTVGTFVMWFGHFLVKTDGEFVFTGWQGLGIGIVVALATPLGDLFESLLKRTAGIKDSGSLLGEHGGVLDRIDALLFAIPIMYAGCFFAGAL